MASSYFSRVNLGVMFPAFVQWQQELHTRLLARGVPYFATSGLRTHEEQAGLYALGRTKANVDATPAKPLGNVVTNAKAGQSFHNFGIAMDWAFDKDQTREGLQPDWSPEAYKALGEEVAKIPVLEWGGLWQFKDYPHVQLKISKVGLELLDLQKAYNTGGLKGVHDLLNRFRW